MRKIYLLCIFTTVLLIGTAGIKSRTKACFEKGKINRSDVTTDLSSSDAEIELTSIQLFSPVHKTVEKKEPILASSSHKRTSLLYTPEHMDMEEAAI